MLCNICDANFTQIGIIINFTLLDIRKYTLAIAIIFNACGLPTYLNYTYTYKTFDVESTVEDGVTVEFWKIRSVRWFFSIPDTANSLNQPVS